MDLREYFYTKSLGYSLLETLIRGHELSHHYEPAAPHTEMQSIIKPNTFKMCKDLWEQKQTVLAMMSAVSAGWHFCAV